MWNLLMTFGVSVDAWRSPHSRATLQKNSSRETDKTGPGQARVCGISTTVYLRVLSGEDGEGWTVYVPVAPKPNKKR